MRRLGDIEARNEGEAYESRSPDHCESQVASRQGGRGINSSGTLPFDRRPTLCAFSRNSENFFYPKGEGVDAMSSTTKANDGVVPNDGGACSI